MLKIGWFSTARGESSRKLLRSVTTSIREGQLKACIEFVFCSREYGESPNTDAFLQEVAEYNLPLSCLSIKKFAQRFKQSIGINDEKLPEWRLEYDRHVMSKLDIYKPDICLLAGYMLIVGPEMCNKYNMINLHPALPDGPKGTWQEVIWALMESRAHKSGVMMHLVTPQLDRGPVITYCEFPITGPHFDHLWQENYLPISRIKAEQGTDNSLFKAIRQAGFIRETPLIIHTLKAFSEGRITITKDKQLMDDQGKSINSYDLTNEINSYLEKQPC